MMDKLDFSEEIEEDFSEEIGEEEFDFKMSNLAIALKSCGWSTDRISKLTLYITTGNEGLLGEIIE